MTCTPRVVAAWATLCLACSEAMAPSPSQPSVPARGGPVVSVNDFGARGDGQTLETAAIQAAIDAVPPGGTLRFPSGVYRIETDKSLRPKDNMRIELGDATLVGDNVKGAKCWIFLIRGRKNVAISGGTLIGSRSGSPNLGMGIFADDSQDLLFENMTFRNFFIDGVILTGNTGCQRVLVRRCTLSNNRRTGIAIVHASDVTVEDSTFEANVGTSPGAGLNVEPNPRETNRNIRISRCTSRRNAGNGIYIHKGLGVAIAEVTVEDNVVEDNGGHGIVASGIDGLSMTGNRIARHRNKAIPGKATATGGITVGDGCQRVTITDNSLEGNLRGIFIAGATGVEIRRNTVVGNGLARTVADGTGGDGIVCLGRRDAPTDECVVANNTVRRVAANGLLAQSVTRVQFLDNTIEDTALRGIYFLSSSNGTAKGNTISGSGLQEAGRYDAIWLEQGSNNNLITGNTIHQSNRLRNPIGIGPGCTGNQVLDNVVLPY
jgi:parallel beta-helix repeat protein